MRVDRPPARPLGSSVIHSQPFRPLSLLLLLLLLLPGVVADALSLVAAEKTKMGPLV